MDSLPISVAALLFFLISAYLYFRNKYSYWEKRGIKGPKPVPVFGNLFSMAINDRWKLGRDWTREFGSVYGIYHGTRPRLVVADAELIRQISIKDFDAFPNHDQNIFLNKYQKEFLFFMQDHNWKQTRALMSTTFTSSKIKRMYKLLDACADDLVEVFDEARSPPMDPRKRYKNARSSAEQNVVNLKDLFSLYTMDAIATCCYSLKLKREIGSTSLQSFASRSDFVRISCKLLSLRWTRYIAASTLPRSLLSKLDYKVSPVDDFVELANVAERMLKSRRAQGASKRFDDYMQLLLEANSEDKVELSESDLYENHHAGLTAESLVADQKLLLDEATQSAKTTKASLSDSEILANTMFLIAVGLETTTSTLTACVYALAFHQQVQDRLFEELSKAAEWNEKKTSLKFDYETLTSCLYLDATISETLRCISPILYMDRISSKDYFIEKYNLRLPKGSKILLGLFDTMNNEKYWLEPEKFNPDRFMPGQRENIVAGSYCPFGLGPRHCLGMRFSLTETKLALAKLMMYFRFEPAPNTLYPPTNKVSVSSLCSISKPLVRVLRRE